MVTSIDIETVYGVNFFFFFFLDPYMFLKVLCFRKKRGGGGWTHHQHDSIVRDRRRLRFNLINYENGESFSSLPQLS